MTELGTAWRAGLASGSIESMAVPRRVDQVRPQWHGGARCSLDLSEATLTRKAVARRMGLSPEAIRIIEIAALEKLQLHPEARALLEVWLEGRAERASPDETGTDDDSESSYEDVGHPGAMARKAREDEAVELWASRVWALRRSGVPLRAALALANRLDGVDDVEQLEGRP